MLQSKIDFDRRLRLTKNISPYSLVLADDGIYFAEAKSIIPLFSDMVLVEGIAFSGDGYQLAYALEQGVFDRNRVFIPMSELIMVFGREEQGVPILHLYTHMGKFSFTFSSRQSMQSWKTMLTTC